VGNALKENEMKTQLHLHTFFIILFVMFYFISLSDAYPKASRVVTVTPPAKVHLSKTLGFSEVVYQIKWSPDGSKLISVDSSKLTVWNTKTWRTQFVISNENITSASWSPDGRYLAATKGDGEEHVLIFDSETGKELQDFKRHPSGDVAMSSITYCAWSPNGKEIATNGAGGVLVVWNASTGESRVLQQSLYQGTVGVSWNPNSQLIVANAGIWNTSTGEMIQKFSDANIPTWNPLGNKIAISSNKNPMDIELLDLRTGKPLIELEGHTGYITSIAWNSDNKYIAGGSIDKTIIIWDTVTGSSFLTLGGHTAPITSVDWSPNGKNIASSSQDHTVNIWSLDLE
jgi:WD40 repeat protein